MPNRTLVMERRASLEWAIETAVKCGYTSDADVLRGILTEMSGQSKPCASAGVIAAARAVIEADRAQTLTTEHVNALDNAIKIQHGELKLPEPRAEVTGWQPIATAPEGQLTVVGWLDPADPEHPERHDFDWLEDGVWQRHFENYEHFITCAPAGSAGPREEAPYTHWMPLLAVPIAAAPQQETRAGVTDCGCETNEACKMKTDGSCWRAD